MSVFPDRSTAATAPGVEWHWISIPIVIALFLAAHALAVFSGGPHAKAASYLFLIAAPLMAAGMCLWRIHRSKERQGWTELTLAMVLWAGGMASNMAIDLLHPKLGDVPGISMLLYVLYGVPLIFAVASPVEERLSIRAIDAALALVLGVLFWIHIFSFASFDHSDEEAVSAIRWLFDIENSFVALFALVRWKASRDLTQRAFFRTLTVYATIYFLAAAFINHWMSDIDFGTPYDLLIGLPFLWLVHAISRHPLEPQAPSHTASDSFALAIRAGSPLMLPATLLAVSSTLLFETPAFAALGFVVATLGYGLRTVLVLMRGISEQERLDRLSHLDALTGLPNRRQFDETLLRTWSCARRAASSVAVLVVDIDHFKQLNDGMGHLVGDERLRAVAQCLSACATRSGDFVGRYGGEEFVAILSDVTEEMAAALAEKMRKNIVALSLPTPASRGMVTISIGLAWTEAPSGDDSQALVSAADRALYRAKENGRDRVEIAARQGETPTYRT